MIVAESFKFVRTFPLTQADVVSSKSGLVAEMDYTPPAYITLLFTDIGISMMHASYLKINHVSGVLTPSAVSDELIKLYL